MFTASSQLSVTLICGPTDMRKAIDGLCNIVAYDLEKEPCTEQLFVFCGRARDKIKILQWSTNGFWLHYKRLETAKANGLIPYDYLVKLFEELPKRQVTDSLDDLLPWEIKLV